MLIFFLYLFYITLFYIHSCWMREASKRPTIEQLSELPFLNSFFLNSEKNPSETSDEDSTFDEEGLFLFLIILTVTFIYYLYIILITQARYAFARQ